VSWGSDTLNKWGQLQGVDVLMGHHGAGLNNGFMMASGSNLIEVRMHDFEVSRPDRGLLACQPARRRAPVPVQPAALSSPDA
jgi:hypothetical protein